MEIFLSIPKYFAVVGICSPQNNSSKIKSYLVLLLICLPAFTSVLFLLLDAKTIVDYTNGFYFAVTFTFIGFVCGIYIWKRKTTFEFITDFEETVQTSKYSFQYATELFFYKFWISIGLKNESAEKVYVKSKKQVDKLIDILYFCFIKFTAHAQNWLKFAVSYYIYFFTDSGDEAFQMVFLW